MIKSTITTKTPNTNAKCEKYNFQDGVLMANRSSPVPRFLLAGLHNNSTLLLRWHCDHHQDDGDYDDDRDDCDDDDEDDDCDDGDGDGDDDDDGLHNNSTVLLR